MGLEVGRITAKIDAQLNDFDQKVTGAQKSFENAAVKMETSAKRTTETLRKAYVERIVAANDAARKEIEAAQKTMRERLRLAGSTAEIAAIRKLYRERVDAAREGATKEIQVAQQAFLASTKGTQPAVAAIKAAGEGGVRAAPGINSVRSAMTALTASALHTAPGVAQVSSVLGAMAVGAPMVIGVLAGIAAITFAWKKLTEQGDELIKKGDDARRSIEAASKSAVDRARENVQALRDENKELEKRQSIFSRLGQAAANAPGPIGVAGSLFFSGKTQKLGETLTANQSAEIKGNQLVTKELEEERQKRIREQEEALAKEQRAFEKYAENLLRIWERTHQKLKFDPFGKDSRIRLDLMGPLQQFMRSFKIDPELSRVLGVLGAAAAGGAQGGGAGNAPPKTNFLSDFLKKKLDPKAIFSSIASGGISTAINFGVGAITKFADSLFDFSGKAKAAAEAMKKAQQEWSKSLDRFILQTTGTDAQKNAADALDRVDEWIKGFEDAFNKGQKLKRPDFKSLDEVLAWAQALLESSFSVDPARAKEWEKFIAAIKVLQTELGKTADAANETVASLINVPNGFKIALARFNATIGSPTLPPSIPSGPRGSWDPVAPSGNMAARTTYVFQGGITVEASDPQDFLRKVEVEAQRKKLRGGATITLDY